MRKVFLISIMLTAMCVIAFWQPSTEELVSSEIMDYEGIEPSETTIYTDSLIKGLYETFGGMIQIEKKKGTILLSYNPHLPQFHRTPLNNMEFMNIHSDEDYLKEERRRLDKERADKRKSKKPKKTNTKKAVDEEKQ